MSIFSSLHTFTEGDERALIDLTHKDAAGSAADLTDCEIYLYARPLKGTGGDIGPITGTIQGAATAGVVRFDCSSICTVGEDDYLCQTKVVDATTATQRSNDFDLRVKAKIG